MTGTDLRTIVKGVLAGLGAAVLFGLAACDDQPYPASPPPASAPPGPAPSAGDLPPPVTAEVPVPPAPTMPASDAVVAMAPIPNPGDPGSAMYYPTAAPPASVRFHPRPRLARQSGAGPTAPGPAGAPFVGSSRAERARAARMLQAQPRHTLRAQAAASAPHPRGAPPPVRTAEASRSPAPGAPVSGATTGVGALQSHMADRIHAWAVLTAPEDPLIGRPFEATLTLPEGFADAFKAEAQKDGLASEAVSATLSATLAGAGYAVMPAEVQTTPLVSGQSLAFHWTVTRQGQAKSPLQANLTGALLGGSTTPLTLGSVQKGFEGGSKVTPRVVGVALLVLVGALVAAWLGRSRRRSRPQEVRRAASGRPLDMTGEDPTL